MEGEGEKTLESGMESDEGERALNETARRGEDGANTMREQRAGRWARVDTHWRGGGGADRWV